MTSNQRTAYEALRDLGLRLAARRPPLKDVDVLFAPALALGGLNILIDPPPATAITNIMTTAAYFHALGFWGAICRRGGTDKPGFPTRKEAEAAARKHWRSFVQWGNGVTPFLKRRAIPPDDRRKILCAELETFKEVWIQPYMAEDRLRLLPPEKRGPGPRSKRTAWEMLVPVQLHSDANIAAEWYAAMDKELGRGVKPEDRPEAILCPLLLNLRADAKGWLYKRRDGMVTENYAKAIGAALDKYRSEKRSALAPLPDEREDAEGQGVPDPKSGEEIAHEEDAEAAKDAVVRLTRAVQEFMADDAAMKAAWKRRKADPRPTFEDAGAEIGKSADDVRNADRKLRAFLERFRPTA